MEIVIIVVVVIAISIGIYWLKSLGDNLIDRGLDAVGKRTFLKEEHRIGEELMRTQVVFRAPRATQDEVLNAVSRSVADAHERTRNAAVDSDEVSGSARFQTYRKPGLGYPWRAGIECSSRPEGGADGVVSVLEANLQWGAVVCARELGEWRNAVLAGIRRADPSAEFSEELSEGYSISE